MAPGSTTASVAAVLPADSESTPRRGLSVSVVVPVGAQAPDVGRCLRSIRALDPPPLEVLVVLDGPSPAAAAVRTAGVEPVELPRCTGPAAARNEGARRARGDLLFFVDSDVTLPGDAIPRVCQPFEDDPGVTALIGSYDDTPGDPGFLSQYRNLLHHFVHQTSPGEGFTFWGACGIIRRRDFLEAGGFDERYRQPSVEDIDLGYRLRADGHRIVLVPELQVKHLKRWSFPDLVFTDLFRRGIPWTRLILRHQRLDSGLNLRPSHRLSAVAGVGLLAGVGMLPFAPLDGLLVIACAMAVMLAANLGFYRFLRERRGRGFSLRAVPLHFMHHVCSGLAAGLGTLVHAFRGLGQGKGVPPLRERAGTP